MPIRGAIFDVDGVLVDTVPLHYRAWKDMFAEFGVSFDEQIYRELVDGKNREAGARSVLVGVSDDVIAGATARKQELYLAEVADATLEAYPDAGPFVEMLTKAGILVAAASGSRNAVQILETIGMLATFETVVTGADVVNGKPDPEIFLTAAQRLGLHPEECVVFEDAEAGVAAARAGGFLTVGVARNGNEHFLSAAHLVVEDLTAVDLDDLMAASRPE